MEKTEEIVCQEIIDYVDDNYERKYDVVAIEHEMPILIIVNEEAPVFSELLAKTINNSFLLRNIPCFNFKFDDILAEHKIVIVHEQNSWLNEYFCNSVNVPTITIKHCISDFDYIFYKNSIKIPKKYNIPKLLDMIIDEIVERLSLVPDENGSAKKFVRNKKDQ